MNFTAYLVANAKSLGIESSDFRPVDSSLLPGLVHRCNESFPQIPAFLWWPHPTTRPEAPPAASRQFLDQLGYQRIPRLVSDPSERVWMFTENWGKIDRRGFDAAIVFDTTPICAHDVIGESHGFEYIIVSQTFDWFIAENDHRFLIVSGDDIVDRLEEIMT
ncbi:DUF6756 family protein [Crateriforma spongiae]|uniref:DUF6756 family protein n=1 Tax=Crateriforma spongiae TaxID=2724528 RepID=UPI0039AFBD0A